MDYIRRIEEDVNHLTDECIGRKLLSMKDASDSALSALKRIQKSYAADVMNRNMGQGSENTCDDDVKLSKFRCKEIAAPYLVACSRADSKTDGKLIMMALNGIQMLLDFEVLPPDHAHDVLMVLIKQASSGTSEIQMKVLQIEVQIANTIAKDPISADHFTEQIVHSLLFLAIELCNGPHVAVTSTASVTIRQITGIVLDSAAETMMFNKGVANRDDVGDVNVNAVPTIGSVKSILKFIKDLSLSCRDESTSWLPGKKLAPSSCLDVLHDILEGWKTLFVDVTAFKIVLKEDIMPTICFRLKSLHDDFVLAAKSSGNISPGTQVAKTVKVARCLLLNYLDGEEFVQDALIVLNLLVQSLRPEQGFNCRLSFKVDNDGYLKNDDSYNLNSVQGMQGIATNLVAGAGGLATSMAEGILNRLSKVPEKQVSCPQSPVRSTIGVAFLGVTLTTPNETVMAHIPAFPAGICLETLLAYFLQDKLTHLAKKSSVDIALFSTLMINVMESTSFLVENGMSYEASVHHFDDIMKSSQLVTHLEGLLSGAEADVDEVIRTIHEIVFATSSISPSEVLILAFQLLQVMVRLVLKYSIAVSTIDIQNIFLTPNGLQAMAARLPRKTGIALNKVAYVTCERTVDHVQDCCTWLLAKVKDASVIRRSLGILTELILSCEFMELQRSSSIMISKMCKLAVPNWHSIEMSSSLTTLKWGHVQAFIRLSQVIHVLADRITDWDMIVDSFDQLSSLVYANRNSASGDVTQIDADKVSAAIDRFKKYTVFLADDSLVKLMTSLVALSMNGLAVSAGASNVPTTKSDEAFRTTNNISPFNLNGEALGSTLYTIIDIVKLNSYRVSIVWQMVTSHLKLIASLKSQNSRKFAVNALFEVIELSFNELKTIPDVCVEEEDDVMINRFEEGPINLTDDVLFNWFLPSFGDCFIGKQFQRNILQKRLKSNSLSGSVHSVLTQAELLLSLKKMATVSYPDVHDAIMQQLFEMLQGGDDVVDEGWSVVIQILSGVAVSMVSIVDTPSENPSFGGTENMEILEDQNQDIQWAKSSLPMAFSCMKLIVDDFLGNLPMSVIEHVITCLSNFSAQVHDINISLTAVEMLWKVVDFILNNDNRDILASVLDVMMTRLLVLSVDLRPEIRNCSLNTLFLAIVSNSELLSSHQWKMFFEDILFPLFAKTEERSSVAMRSQEKAIAPELKKGVKMAVHHSRDTAHKQWSESRVLALKGLIRVVKACSKSLLIEPWFPKIWAAALDICVRAIQAINIDKEVSLAGVDTLFAMAKSISSNKEKQKDDLLTDDDAIRESLFLDAWKSIKIIAHFSVPNAEIPLRIATDLQELYNCLQKGEFRVDGTFIDMLDIIVCLSRPRKKMCEVHSSKENDFDKKTFATSEVQLSRTILKLLKQVRPINVNVFSHFMSRVCEIALSSRFAISEYVNGQDSIMLGPVNPMLRCDVADFIFCIYDHMQNAVTNGKR